MYLDGTESQAEMSPDEGSASIRLRNNWYTSCGIVEVLSLT